MTAMEEVEVLKTEETVAAEPAEPQPAPVCCPERQFHPRTALRIIAGSLFLLMALLEIALIGFRVKELFALEGEQLINALLNGYFNGLLYPPFCYLLIAVGLYTYDRSRAARIVLGIVGFLLAGILAASNAESVIKLTTDLFAKKIAWDSSKTVIVYYASPVLLALGLLVGSAFLVFPKRRSSMIGIGFLLLLLETFTAIALSYLKESAGKYYRMDLLLLIMRLIILAVPLLIAIICYMRCPRKDGRKPSLIPLGVIATILACFLLALQAAEIPSVYGYVRYLIRYPMPIDRKLNAFADDLFPILYALGTLLTVIIVAFSEKKERRKGADWAGYCGITKHVLLLFFTFGIWYLIWIYRVTKHLNGRQIEERRSPGAQVLLCMFIPFYQIFWTYQTAHLINVLAKDKEVPSDIILPCLLLSIFAPIVPPMILQDRLNAIISKEHTENAA